MSAFAEGTQVPVERSRAEIEAMVVRYGAKSFVCGWEEGRAVILFDVKDRKVRFDLPIPDVNDKRFATTGKKDKKSGDKIAATPQQRVNLHAAETRRRWRAMALVIKAKLESVASGIETFEESFLAHIIVPGGKTFGEWAIPQIAQAYKTGVNMPPLLGAGS